MMFRKKLLTSAIASTIVGGGAAAVFAAPVLAQDERQATGRAIEEVVVTATRRAESVQDVPLSVTAISADAIERVFPQDARDLNGMAPNVQLLPVGAFQNAAAFYIRGVGSSDIESATDPGIATFINEVYQGRTSTALQDFVDIASVEVLRGPQGTLFGRNAIGGVVHVRHNEPDLTEASFGAAALVGDFGRFDVKAMGNLPINDTLAFRVAAKSTNSDGFYKNRLIDAPDVNSQDRITVLPSLKWTPNDAWDVTVRGEYNRTRDDSWANVSYSACRSDPRTTAPFTGGNDVVIDFIAGVFGNPEDAARFCGREVGGHSFNVEHDQPIGSFSNFDIWGITAQVDHHMDGLGTFSYIGNYRSVEEDVANDFDSTPYNIFHTQRIQDHYQFSHELRFASDFADDVRMVAGLYYFEQEYEMDQFTRGALVAPAPEIFGNSLQLNQAWAAFAHVDWNVTPEFVLTAGIRYSEEEKEFEHCGVGFGDPVTRTCQLDFGEGPVSTLLVADEKWTDVSPKLGVSYFFAEDMMAYATWARGFRSGGFNGRGNTPFSIGPFDEENADNYEIGVKMDLWDRRLRLNLAAFLMDYQDLQRATIRPAPGGAGQETVTDNVGSAENRGVELELTALLTDSFSVNLTLGWLDASNENWCSAVRGVSPTPEAPEGFTQCAPATEVFAPTGESSGFLVPIDVSNLPPPQSPEWQSRLDLVYEFPFFNGGNMTLVGTWMFSDEVSLVAAGLPAGTLEGIVNYDGTFINPRRDSWNIYNASATWRSADDNIRASLFVKNITDEIYASTGTFVAGLFNFVQVNQPRHWGLELAYRM
jgi:iron complex outermembrane recepter protein